MSEEERLRAMMDVLLGVARLYVSAFKDDEAMTLPERLMLQRVQDIVADPDGWSPQPEQVGWIDPRVGRIRLSGTGRFTTCPDGVIRVVPVEADEGEVTG